MGGASIFQQSRHVVNVTQLRRKPRLADARREAGHTDVKVPDGRLALVMIKHQTGHAFGIKPRSLLVHPSTGKWHGGRTTIGGAGGRQLGVGHQLGGRHRTFIQHGQLSMGIEKKRHWQRQRFPSIQHGAIQMVERLQAGGADAGVVKRKSCFPKRGHDDVGCDGVRISEPVCIQSYDVEAGGGQRLPLRPPFCQFLQARGAPGGPQVNDRGTPRLGRPRLLSAVRGAHAQGWQRQPGRHHDPH